MKATISGVAFSAAKIRSPSFSRSSSSMTMTALPAAMSATALSTESNLVIFATSPFPLTGGNTVETAHTRSPRVAFSMNHRGGAVIAAVYQRDGFGARARPGGPAAPTVRTSSQ